jgi:hypothetical protein
MTKLEKIESIDKDVDERYAIEVTWTTGIDAKGNRVKVTRYEKQGRWAEVVNNLKYSIAGRSNAKVIRDNGATTTYSHVANADSAAMKYANGGNWDFDPSYSR